MHNVYIYDFIGEPSGIKYGDSFNNNTTATAAIFESTNMNEKESTKVGKKVDNDKNVKTEIPSRHTNTTIVKGKERRLCQSSKKEDNNIKDLTSTFHHVIHDYHHRVRKYLNQR